MAAKRNLLFIVNPIAGGKRKRNLHRAIGDTVDKSLFKYEIVYTDSEDHARRLSRSAAGSFELIAAAGGDGTVNEVARGIMEGGRECQAGDRPVTLAIVPSGSGNGLARHLGIPMRASAAINLINRSKVRRIDAGSMNGVPFLCVAGTGFDAHISHLFAKETSRGFSGYVRSALREIRMYKPAVYQIRTGREILRRKAFLISIANAAQYGNNAYIAPAASIADGLLDLCILSPFPFYRYPEMAWRLMTGRIAGSRYMQTIRGREFTIEREKEGAVHLDGEPRDMGRELNIEVMPALIPVVVP